MSDKQYLSKKEEARRINASERSLDRYCKDAGYPYIRLGNRVLFDPELSDQFLAARIHNGRAAELSKQAA